MCQDTPHILKKLNARSDSQTVASGLNLNAVAVRKSAKKKYRITEGVRVISAHAHAKESDIKTFRSMNNRITEECGAKTTLNGFIQLDTESHTQKGLRISKHEGTLGNVTQKALILLRSGKNFAEKIIGGVLFAKKGRSSLKTIFNHFLKKAQTIYQTFNPFVGIAIVASGSFNIYSNPELIKHE